MAKIKELRSCDYCKADVKVIFSQTAKSRSAKVKRCKNCGKQNSVKSLFQ